MGVTLRMGREGEPRPYWYGVFSVDGKRRVVNLAVGLRGNRHPSGSLRKPGDGPFEASRKEARAAFKAAVVEARRKGRAEHLTERLIEAKTGRAVTYTRLDELPDRWRALGRASPAGEGYLAYCAGVFNRFAAAMKQIRRDNRPGIAHLYEVRPEDAAAYAARLQRTFAPKTARDAVKLLRRAFDRFLPVGMANPFAGFVGRRGNGDAGQIHRKPFTADELTRILEAAREDDFLFPLVTTAACTGMRRGDVCRLRWRDVDLAGGMLTVKTSKTGATVEIPIFPPLRDALKEYGKPGGVYVFPTAAQMCADNPDGVTYRFKALVARVFASGPNADKPAPQPPAPPAGEIEAAGMAAIVANLPEGPRRDRTADNLRRYLAGAGLKRIARATGQAQSGISGDLHLVEQWIGQPVMRPPRRSIKEAIAKHTRVEREIGNAGSVRDWHALRATWVTLALTAGVPMELVRRVTGHATVDVVLKHYFRPGREQFKAALAGALPAVLTGGKAVRMAPAEELQALAAKLTAGTATDEDKKRLRLLAAKV